ncbi:MAG: S41 family peptidase, partial [Thermomicrobiales bacterium]
AVGDTGHSAFLDPVEAQSYRASLNGELIGVGIRIEFNGEYPQVIAPIDGSPAESAGIESGDFILKIDGRDTSRMTPNEVGTLLRGEEGAPVDLTIGRPETETEFDITIVRARIEVEPVAWAELPDGLFLLRLNEFSEGAGEALTQAIEEVIAGGATGIVLDLRGNPGGYVDEAKRVASEFLPAGSVLYFEQRRGEEPEPITLDREAGAARTMPLVVLVNERSASAAEIVAASLRDNARAEVIGVNTFGTATVVSSFGLDDGSIASIGTALWTTPNRESVRNVGVSPTIEVKLSPLADETEFESGSFLTLAEIHANDDAQLLAAIELLSPPDVLPTALTA